MLKFITRFLHKFDFGFLGAGNLEGLGAELFETLVKMAPTKEEEIKLKDYNGDLSKLGAAERFLKGILDIPFAFKRVEAMLYRVNFDAEVKYLTKSFETLEVKLQISPTSITKFLFSKIKYYIRHDFCILIQQLNIIYR